jgi:cytidyltransferase-like protein
MDRIWINGCFDILHRGHIELINFASSYGIVRVGIDTDDRVKKLKGQNRPFNTIADRVYVVKNIKGVDSVEAFYTEEELEYCIKKWNPKYIIVGDDYKNKKVVGSQYCEEVIYFKKIKGYSTSKILG